MIEDKLLAAVLALRGVPLKDWQGRWPLNRHHQHHAGISTASMQKKNEELEK